MEEAPEEGWNKPELWLACRLTPPRASTAHAGLEAVAGLRAGHAKPWLCHSSQ